MQKCHLNIRLFSTLKFFINLTVVNRLIYIYVYMKHIKIISTVQNSKSVKTEESQEFVDSYSG